MIFGEHNIKINTEYLKTPLEYGGAKLKKYILEPDPLRDTVCPKRPAVIVCPGGGYKKLSSREAEPMALKFCAAGFHAFVLEYSIAPVGWPVPTCELSAAVNYVRSVGDEYFIDKDRIFVCGFSAGGHLAAGLGVFYDYEIIKSGSYSDGISNRPNGLILGYPVITSKPGRRHDGTFDNFCRGKFSAADYFSLEERVSPDTPPCFIWHTAEDISVPVYNSLAFAAALRDNNVMFELHVYPRGAHGCALANEITTVNERHLAPEAERWIDDAVRWVKVTVPGILG